MTAAVGMALAAASAFMQYRQGQAQQAMFEGQARGLEVQAEYTRCNAKGESLKYKKQAADELEGTLVRMAQINAAAGAGHMDPFTGNPFGLRIRALDVGGTNFAMAGLNEKITILTGESQAQMQLYQAARARAAGKTAKRMATMSAMLTLASGAAGFAQTSTPGSTTGMTLNPGGAGAGWQTNQYSVLANPSSSAPFYSMGNSQFLGPQVGYLGR